MTGVCGLTNCFNAGIVFDRRRWMDDDALWVCSEHALNSALYDATLLKTWFRT